MDDPRLVAVVYADHSMSFDDYDPDLPWAPIICTVIGYELPRKEFDWIHVASEKTDTGWRAVTHIHSPSVLHVTELVAKPRKGG